MKVEGFEKEPYPQELYGQFFSAECFLIIYKYLQKNLEKTLIYFWQGRDASIVRILKYFYYINFFQNERGSSAYLTKQTSDNLENENSQVFFFEIHFY